MARKQLDLPEYTAKMAALREQVRAAENDAAGPDRDDRIDALLNDHIAAHIPDNVQVLRHGSGGKGRVEVRLKNQIPF